MSHSHITGLDESISNPDRVADGVFLHYLEEGFTGNPPWDSILIAMFARLESQNTANVSIF